MIALFIAMSWFPKAGIILLVVALAPLPLFMYEWHEESKRIERSNAEVSRRETEGNLVNERAFAESCKGRQRRILSAANRAPRKPGSQRARFGDGFWDGGSVLVRVEGEVPGMDKGLYAEQIARFMRLNPAACRRAGIDHLDGVHNRTDMPRRFSACEETADVAVPHSDARYELILGEPRRNEALPWQGAGLRWMTVASIRLLDRSEGKLLAEDELYFVRYSTWSAECPAPVFELAELLMDVFAPQPTR